MNKKLLAGLVGIAGLITVSGCEKPPARVEPPPPKVTVANPELRDYIEADQYNGWLDAAETVEVRARVRGHIQKVNFTDGQLVKKGDMLFELDPRPFEADINRQKDQKAVYAAQLLAAQKDAARLRELLGRGGASQSQVEKAEADAQSLEAQLNANEQEIIRRGLDLEYSKITAPIAGRISRALMTEGNLVNAGGSDPLLTTIVSIDPIYVYFAIDERALQRYMKQREQSGEKQARTGHVKDLKIPIRFALETDTDYPHEGVVDFADNQVDRTTGTIMARATVANPEARLVPGARVRVRVPTSASRQVTLVPDTAILTDQDKKYVLVVDEKKVVQRRDITQGRLLDDGMRIVLPSGQTNLTAQDRIITAGLQMSRLNYPVEPVAPSTQPATH